MSHGSGVIAARQAGAAELVDLRPYAVGSLRDVFVDFPHIGPLLPAMGYGEKQMKELEETIRRTPCDVVVVATPMDLGRVIRIVQPTVRVNYDVIERGPLTLSQIVRDFVTKHVRATA
jgi:predicted GTPase